MTSLTSLCVFCGSRAHEAHQEAARRLGRLAAERGVEIVFGGGRVGLMGVVAEAAMATGGRVYGVIPEFLKRREVEFGEITELVVVDSMHSRKRIMFDRADAFCVLPGGLGTLDETIEIVTWRQLGLHDKPVFLINIDGFWDPFVALIRHQADAGYLHAEHLAQITVLDNVDEVFAAADAAASSRPGSDLSERA